MNYLGIFVIRLYYWIGIVAYLCDIKCALNIAIELLLKESKLNWILSSFKCLCMCMNFSLSKSCWTTVVVLVIIMIQTKSPNLPGSVRSHLCSSLWSWFQITHNQITHNLWREPPYSCLHWENLLHTYTHLHLLQWIVMFLIYF